MKSLRNFKEEYTYPIFFLLGLIILFFRSRYIFDIPQIYTEDGAWLGGNSK